MSEVVLLNKILFSSVIVQPNISGEKKSVLLNEEDGGYTINIKGIPSESIVIKTDLFPPLKGIFFKGDDGECKRSDYAIILKKESQKIILLLELKAKNSTSTNDHIKKQLKGGVCVIEYIKSIAKNFFGDPDFLCDYEYRFVAIVDVKVDKKPTRNKPSNSIHNSIENMMKITGTDSMYLKRLIDQPCN